MPLNGLHAVDSAGEKEGRERRGGGGGERCGQRTQAITDTVSGFFCVVDIAGRLCARMDIALHLRN